MRPKYLAIQPIGNFIAITGSVTELEQAMRKEGYQLSLLWPSSELRTKLNSYGCFANTTR